MLSARSRFLFVLLFTAVLIVVGAAPASADDAVLVISPGVKAYLDQYLRTRQPLAFAVSADGTRSGYVYCEDYNCRNENYRNRALGLCAKVGGKGCKILAVGTDIKLAYRVDPALSRPLFQVPDSARKDAPPCVDKPEEICNIFNLAFDLRRKEIETKWRAEIGRIERQLCQGYLSRRPSCKTPLEEAEARRDAELKALDEEFRTTMAE